MEYHAIIPADAVPTDQTLRRKNSEFKYRTLQIIIINIYIRFLLS